jgi:predicted nuclease of predicted toxin-antitoxin system
LKDSIPLDRAEMEGRIVVTLDKDLWQTAVQRRPPMQQSGAVLFRTHPATVEQLTPLVRAFMDANAEWMGHVSIISPSGIQMVAVRMQ